MWVPVFCPEALPEGQAAFHVTRRGNPTNQTLNPKALTLQCGGGAARGSGAGRCGAEGALRSASQGTPFAAADVALPIWNNIHTSGPPAAFFPSQT